MSGDLADYYFTADSVHVHKRKLTNKGTVEERYSRKMTMADLNRLLEVLKINRVDKIEMRKTKTQIHDGAAFSLHLIDKGRFIVMLSNGANQELSNEDEARLFKVQTFIKSIVNGS